MAGHSIQEALGTLRTTLPDPTPADGPDPYGDPDPEWLRIDWSAHRQHGNRPDR